MAVRIGIDEAGYGPLLGPLVVGATAWRAPDDCDTSDLWAPLALRVPKGGARRVAVAGGDSKQIYEREKGLGSLERSVLAFLNAVHGPLNEARELLNVVGVTMPADSHPIPWYRSLNQSLPRDRNAPPGGVASERLCDHMQTQPIRCVAMRAEVACEDRFNARVTHTRNKAAFLVEIILRLVDGLLRQHPGERVHVVVDRLGGRADYRGLLMAAFPEREMRVLEVSQEVSRYALRGSDGGEWEFTFCVEADAAHLPVALASMLAKYVRELLMEQFNAYWCGLVPGLRPTAGYYNDALRFLTDIEPAIPAAGLTREQFVRAR